jgi:hypothetical protein
MPAMITGVTRETATQPFRKSLYEAPSGSVIVRHCPAPEIRVLRSTEACGIRATMDLVECLTRPHSRALLRSPALVDIHL